MKKKIAVYGVLLILFAATSVYFRSSRLTHLLPDHQQLEKISSSIFFSAHSSKDLEVDQAEDIQDIFSLFAGFKVRKAMFPPNSPKFKQTYDLTLYYPNDQIVKLEILNNKMLRIDGRAYRILQAPGLGGLYNLIIAAQPEGTINSFYYSQMCELDFSDRC